MKILAVTLLCALAGKAVGGAIAWPGAVPYTAGVLAAPTVLKTVIPQQTKTTAYSSTQYINAVPAAPYAFGVPQFAVPVQQATSLTSLPGYYSVAQFPFGQATNVYYPAQPGFSGIYPGLGIAPAAPAAPEAPANLFPSQPSTPVQQDQSFDQQNGDADTAVIESADSSVGSQRNEQPIGSNAPSQQPSQPSYLPPASTFPNFPGIPQVPQGPSQNPQGQPPHGISQSPQIPSSPQSPQESQPQAPQAPQSPSFPQFPQFPQLPQFPGFPQGSPSFPQIPGLPQFPSNLFPQTPQGPTQSPPSSFPGSINGDTGLNDEDTISVESA